MGRAGEGMGVTTRPFEGPVGGSREFHAVEADRAGAGFCDAYHSRMG